MRTVARISITPVKSLGLHHPDEVRLETFGVAENRRFYLAEPDGRLVNGAGFGPLVAIRAEYRARNDGHDEWLSLRFPDQTIVEGNPCHVGATVETDFFGQSARGSILEGPWAAALSAYAGRPLILVRSGEIEAWRDRLRGLLQRPEGLSPSASADRIRRRYRAGTGTVAGSEAHGAGGALRGRGCADG